MAYRRKPESNYRTPQRGNRRGGIEPLQIIKISDEDRLISIAPDSGYDVLVIVMILIGLCLALTAVFFPILFSPNEVDAMRFIGALIMFGGLWAGASNDRMKINVAKGTYTRLEGQFLKKIYFGRIQELAAITAVSHSYIVYPRHGDVFTGHLHSQNFVTHRLVLSWKGDLRPILVLALNDNIWFEGAALNSTAGPLLETGHKLASLLNIPLIDNTAFSTEEPVPVL